LNGEFFGRPRKRWFQEVKNDLREVRTGKWKEKAQEGDTWQPVVKETKAHQGL
jgi:hypothetical protein